MTLRDLARCCDDATRRSFVSAAAAALLGVGASPLLERFAWARRLAGGQDPQDPKQGGGTSTGGEAPIVLGRASAQSVIYLFLRGGMSHVDTFDPKPGTRVQGPVEAIRTRADGVLLGQYFPKLAEHMDKVCVVSSLSSNQGAHPQAQYLMRTSFEKRGTITHASLGAWANRLAGKRNATLPGHVIVGGGGDMPGAGWMPPQFQALPIGDADAGLQNAALPKGVTDERFRRRLQRLGELDAAFAEKYAQRGVRAYAETYADAVRLMRSSDLAAFDVGLETEPVRAAYGDTPFGAGCLLARRLVEHGVRFVEVCSDGWDTHADNFDRLTDLTPPVDQALAALLADLHVRGLLEETMVVVATEFGRTPDIDQDQGRNHYPKAFSCLLAGGGVAGGRRFGKTDAEGREVVDDAVTIQDFNATIAHALGLPLDHVLMSPAGRPFKVADKGEPILGIFS